MVNIKLTSLIFIEIGLLIGALNYLIGYVFKVEPSHVVYVIALIFVIIGAIWGIFKFIKRRK